MADPKKKKEGVSGDEAADAMESATPRPPRALDKSETMTAAPKTSMSGTDTAPGGIKAWGEHKQAGEQEKRTQDAESAVKFAPWLTYKPQNPNVGLGDAGAINALMVQHKITKDEARKRFVYEREQKK